MYFILSLSIFLNVVLIYGFNIDTNHAIVHRDPSIRFNGRSTYFGYSVIMYGNHNTAWVQIGTPRGNISNYNKIKEPGVVYRCNIFGPCNMIDVDASSSYDRRTRYLDVVPDKEVLNGSWIGGTMDIDLQSGVFVVCGHRWKRIKIVNTKINYYVRGACYWSRENKTKSEKIIPLRNKESDIITRDDINVFYYAHGQAGTCAHFTNSHELLLGAPGLIDWHGNAIILQHSIANTQSRSGPSPVINVVVAERENPTEEVAYEYFGYSTTSGYYFNKNELLYASGAPRDRYKGKVQVFKLASSSNKTEVKTSEEGRQVGEYFGGALTSGDINRDGLDDLIVGAPYYGSNTYNQGRIYIFLGSLQGKFETPERNSIIEGENAGDQFGASLMFLGDFNNDGYASVAVGAPYENDGSGSVYIYRGTEVGLTILSQKLIGKSFVPTIKGFGISISKPTDVDTNSYNDLAIGAYLSSHVVILRSKPTIKIEQSLTSLASNLVHNSKKFEITACFRYSGYAAPPQLTITRNITVDELLHRADLPPNIPMSENITLKNNIPSCQNITVSMKENNQNNEDPMIVTISSNLILHLDHPNTIFVSYNRSNIARDTFCKDCSILNPFLSTKEQSIVLPFALDCGADNVCKTNLALFRNFLKIQNNNYVLGSTEDLDVEFIVHNSEENAYRTKIIIELPKSIYFKRIPNYCSDQGDSIIICNIGNPIRQNENRTVNLTLDMRSILIGDKLQFKTTLETSSQNLNGNNFEDILNVSRNADLLITGTANEQSYLLDNSTKNGLSTFTHTFQIEKYGSSPVEEVVLTLSIPSRILKSEWVTFAEFYAPIGVHGNQPIYCISNVEYLYDGLEASEQILMEDLLYNSNIAKRSVENVVVKNETDTEFGYASNRIFNINCSDDENIICSKIECKIGPFTNKKNVAKVQLNMRLNITALSDQLGTKDIIVLSTEGKVVVLNPINFVQTGSRSDEVRISSVFIKEIPEVTVEFWIIIVAVVAGISLLGLLILGLIKVGFFKRKIKEELQALKQESAELMEFVKEPERSSNEEDDQMIDEEITEVL